MTEWYIKIAQGKTSRGYRVTAEDSDDAKSKALVRAYADGMTKPKIAGYIVNPPASIGA